MSTLTPEQYLYNYCRALYDADGGATRVFWLEDAANGMNGNKTGNGWGSADRYNLAQALIAAHNWTRAGAFATVDLGDGQLAAQSPGAIASQTTIRESVAYGNPGVNNVDMGAVAAEWSTTPYGRLLLRIIRTRPAFRFFFVSAPGPIQGGQGC